MIDETRLVEIEMKLTHQEDTVDALNKIVYEQQRKIDELEKLLTALVRQVKDSANSIGEQRTTDNERPPHY